MLLVLVQQGVVTLLLNGGVAVGVELRNLLWFFLTVTGQETDAVRELKTLEYMYCYILLSYGNNACINTVVLSRFL
jgi:hypothetical protein